MNIHQSLFGCLFGCCGPFLLDPFGIFNLESESTDVMRSPRMSRKTVFENGIYPQMALQQWDFTPNNFRNRWILEVLLPLSWGWPLNSWSKRIGRRHSSTIFFVIFGHSFGPPGHFWWGNLWFWGRPNFEEHQFSRVVSILPLNSLGEFSLGFVTVGFFKPSSGFPSKPRQLANCWGQKKQRERSLITHSLVIMCSLSLDRFAASNVVTSLLLQVVVPSTTFCHLSLCTFFSLQRDTHKTAHVADKLLLPRPDNIRTRAKFT